LLGGETIFHWVRRDNYVEDTPEEWYHVVMNKGTEEGMYTLLFGGEV